MATGTALSALWHTPILFVPRLVQYTDKRGGAGKVIASKNVSFAKRHLIHSTDQADAIPITSETTLHGRSAARRRGSRARAVLASHGDTRYTAQVRVLHVDLTSTTCTTARRQSQWEGQ